MKKILFLSIMIFSLNVFGEQLNPFDYEKQFAEASSDYDSLLSSKAYRAVQLINTIESSTYEQDTRLLTILLHLELDEIKRRMSRNDEILRENIESSTNSIYLSSDIESIKMHLQFLRFAEKSIEKIKECYLIVQDWEEKYKLGGE